MTIAPGNTTWIDLGTHDLEAAQAFYHELFGWNYTSTGPHFGGYLMVDRGVPVCGMGLNMDMEGNLDLSMPTWWTVYFKVTDVADAVAAVAENGGNVFVPPMQIGDMGSMAIVSAPSGAAFGVWEAGSFEGFDTSGTVGLSCWYESLTKDYSADVAFYAAVLGWENVPMGPEAGAAGSEQFADEPSGQGAPDNMGRYSTNFGERATAGVCEANAWLPEDAHSFWRVYFRVEDTDAAIAKIQELGGTVLDGPMDSPFGRLATVADPQGGMFQIIQ